MCLPAFFCVYLLYFWGYVEGMERVACRLLYPIFRAGWGLLYFIVIRYRSCYNIFIEVNKKIHIAYCCVDFILLFICY